jgi:hypothetical protein
MIKAKFFESDELNELEDQVNDFFRENTNIEEHDILKLYFNSIPIFYKDSYRSDAEHRAFIVYEDNNGFRRK